MYILWLGKKTLKNILLFVKQLFLFFPYLSQFFKLKKVNDGRFSLNAVDIHPCLKDKVTYTPFDQHYIYHPAWAARVLAQTKPALHVDISSLLDFSSIVSAFVPVKFYDYRPAKLTLNNFESDFADLKQLPFDSNSIESISCMHTIEHIGLGRYGDELDIKGDIKSINELKRVVRPGGDLLFVTPVGKPKIEFNAHRVYAYEQIMEYFSGFKLIEFSLVPDAGGLIKHARPETVKEQKYGCGCFWFKKV